MAVDFLHSTRHEREVTPHRKKIAIVQSNYIPWKGYFDLINSVDEFIILDEVQFTKNDWRNRNKIKSRTGLEWLSIPVRQENLGQTISSTRVLDGRWAGKHWKTICHNYSRSVHFDAYAKIVEQVYAEAAALQTLSEVNLLFIQRICELMGITTTISSCTDYELRGDRVERLINLCHHAGGDTYLSGPAARMYMNETAFDNSGIALEWMDYSGYGKYNQLFPPFEHGVTILDLLFNAGPDYKIFMKSF